MVASARSVFTASAIAAPFFVAVMALTPVDARAQQTGNGAQRSTPDSSLVAKANPATASDAPKPPENNITIPVADLRGEGPEAGEMAAGAATQPERGGWIVAKIHTSDQDVINKATNVLKGLRRGLGDQGFNPAIILADGNAENQNKIEIYSKGYKIAWVKLTSDTRWEAALQDGMVKTFKYDFKGDKNAFASVDPEPRND